MEAAQISFISSTYWTDKIGPVAALTTLKKHSRLNVGSHLIKIGNLMQEGWKKLGEKHQLDIRVSGIPPLSHWSVQSNESQLLHTVVVEKMLKKGFLTSNAFYSTYAHTEENVASYMNKLDGVLGELAVHIKENRLGKVYNIPIAHSGFKRLT